MFDTLEMLSDWQLFFINFSVDCLIPSHSQPIAHISIFGRLQPIRKGIAMVSTFQSVAVHQSHFLPKDHSTASLLSSLLHPVLYFHLFS